MKQPLWLKYRNEGQDLQKQVEKKRIEILFTCLDDSRQQHEEKQEKLTTLEKALKLALAKYERERYNGLLAYASGILDEFNANAFGKFCFVLSIGARALVLSEIFRRVGPKLKAIEDEIKKLGGKPKVHGQKPTEEG